MNKIISFANQKGGVAKTTTAVNLAASLPGKVLLIDMEPQGDASVSLGVDPEGLDHTVFTLLTGNSKISDTLIHTKWCDLLPANDDLSELDMLLIEHRHKLNPVTVLKNSILSIQDQYDYVLIDCPPGKGLLTINALVASTHVIIPMQCEYFSTRGVSKIIQTINKVQSSYNANLALMGIVPTMYNTRTNLSSIVLQQARRFFLEHDMKVFDTTIHKCIKFAEAPTHGEPAVIVYPDNEHVQAYKELAKEIAKYSK